MIKTKNATQVLISEYGDVSLGYMTPTVPPFLSDSVPSLMKLSLLSALAVSGALLKNVHAVVVPLTFVTTGNKTTRIAGNSAILPANIGKEYETLFKMCMAGGENVVSGNLLPLYPCLIREFLLSTLRPATGEG